MVNHSLKYCYFYLSNIEADILKIHPLLIKNSDCCFTKENLAEVADFSPRPS